MGLKVENGNRDEAQGREWGRGVMYDGGQRGEKAQVIRERGEKGLSWNRCRGEYS